MNDEQLAELWVLLTQAYSSLRLARKKELAKHDLDPNEAGVLFSVDKLGSQARLSEISRWVFLTPQSVHETITKMESKGLLTKGRDPNRRNLTIVKLTEKGEKALGHASKRQSIKTAMSSLSDDQLQQLSSSLQVLRTKALRMIGRPDLNHYPPFL